MHRTSRARVRALLALLALALLVPLAVALPAARAAEAATLTLTPDHGSLNPTIIAHGENFWPGSTVQIYGGKADGHVFADLTYTYPTVAADGTFDVELDAIAPVLGYGAEAPIPGTRFVVIAQTGHPKEDSVDGPSASAIYTVELTTEAPANPHFQQRWERTDKPVADMLVSRTWMWGPGGFTGAVKEYYEESPGDYRTVQYFDKSRMEITQPDAHAPNLWYVTNGLLVRELMTGMLQLGDDRFEMLVPSEIGVAGDPGDPNAPSYAAMNRVADLPAREAGRVVVDTIDRNGATGIDETLARYDVTAYYYVAATGHQVAEPFWNFMTSSGPVYEDGRVISDELFLDRFYATGYPLTEAYWTRVEVNGVAQDVLVQAFERRVLTYTPGNPAGWQVESGNVGRHYYEWRYIESHQ